MLLGWHQYLNSRKLETLVDNVKYAFSNIENLNFLITEYCLQV